MPVTRLRWASVLAVGGAVLLGACSGGGASHVVGRAAAGDRAPRTETIQASVRATATGAAALSYDAPTAVTVSRFDPANPALSLLTVGLAEFSRAGGGQRFRTAFDLAGTYHGPGTYSFGAGGAGSSSLSNAFLQIVELRDVEGSLGEANVAKADRFDRTLEPCHLEVGAGERSGSLRCPRLSDGSGAEIAFELSWKA